MKLEVSVQGSYQSTIIFYVQKFLQVVCTVRTFLNTFENQGLNGQVFTASGGRCHLHKTLQARAMSPEQPTFPLP